MKFMFKLTTRVRFADAVCLLALALLAVSLVAPAAAGNITQYIGVDDGAPVTGPFPASSNSQAMFESAASGIGTLNTITFETLPVGFQTSFVAAPGVTVTVNAPDLGSGLSGINNFTLGNTNGFNITPNGHQWFGFPQGSATFTFASGTQSFGVWLTGTQASMLSALNVTFNDGQAESLRLPINTNGGAAFSGFTDPGSNISAITITGVGTDAWGIDDVTYNLPAQLTLPEPSSILLLLGGAAALMGTVRRKLRYTP
jgi:hypothetical protein